jgi:hypothetical protein
LGEVDHGVCIEDKAAGVVGVWKAWKERLQWQIFF